MWVYNAIRSAWFERCIKHKYWHKKELLNPLIIMNAEIISFDYAFNYIIVDGKKYQKR